MLIEVVQNSESNNNNNNNINSSGFVRMERPKSAKYNLERYKKSSAHASRFNRNYIENIAETNENLDTAIIDENVNNSKRYQGSKSAYVGNVRLRPQSARHNLEKYRQDIVREQQLKILKLKESENLDNVQKDPDPIVDQEDDLDNLDGLLIGEEDSTSELDSNESLTNLDLNKKIKNKKLSKLNKKKLLSKRTGTNTVVTVGPQVILNNQNLPQKTANLNVYTTFRPTAVTTNYSTNSNTKSNLKIVHLHPEKESEKELDQTNGSINTSNSTTSSSSSSSSKPENLENKKISVKNDLTSRELLNEWLKNDDEIDLNINNNNNNNNNVNINHNNEDVLDENFFYHSKYQNNLNRLIVRNQVASGRTTRSDLSSNSNFSRDKSG
ncbi:unnamed protein product, partial [Brachionus calyciflorus]